jgi:hypothetical protein
MHGRVSGGSQISPSYASDVIGVLAPRGTTPFLTLPTGVFLRHESRSGERCPEALATTCHHHGHRRLAKQRRCVRSAPSAAISLPSVGDEGVVSGMRRRAAICYPSAIQTCVLSDASGNLRDETTTTGCSTSSLRACSFGDSPFVNVACERARWFFGAREPPPNVGPDFVATALRTTSGCLRVMGSRRSALRGRG